MPGQTILEVAREHGIFIPTLCYDPRTEIYGSCGLCLVEWEGNPKLWKACATEIAEGMVIKTNTERVRESRKTNLELLLSNHRGDCRPPCVLACPGGTDCQGYVGLLANGETREALKLIKEKIPLPASLGRVCPHPCEEKCRRRLIEEPVSIQWLKRFAADEDLLADDPYLPETAPDTGKHVAIIGGGPMGLSAAAFLREMGHGVTVYEAMPKAGGMLRYGIPEYRLPKEVLDLEISLIQRMGARILTGVKVGEDLSFDALRREYDAVVLAIGAWISTGVGCPGEDAEGVLGGIDFLRKAARGEDVTLGKRVAIVGGGNTAMDACRTAVRLGAETVYNVYRRTRDEMPADPVEIEEALEEGVVFQNLTNPLQIETDEDGKVTGMVLQIMELGEPDASGRRAPRPVEGKTEHLEVDTVILAIGQAVDSSLFETEKTKRGAIAYDPQTFMTSLPGVFAGGDCGNDKISIAIEAIADARKASYLIDAYLKGEEVTYQAPYLVEREDITEKTFEDRERQCRPQMAQLSPEERRDNFTEVVSGYTPEQAMQEAERCLSCGCHDYFECKLIDLANQYDASPARFAGDKNEADYEDDHPFIARDPNKCILCGLCVRVCDEVMGVGALGLVHRGFDTLVLPALEKPLAESGCLSCGQCVSVCPTGALQERQTLPKEVPLETESTDTTCSFCSLGCSLKLETRGDLLVKAVGDPEGPVNTGLLCGRGKWGFDCAQLEGKPVDPLLREDGEMRKADYHEALVLTAKKVQGIAARYGRDAVAVSISDRYTNEEAYVMKKLAASLGAKALCFNTRENGLAKVLGFDASPNTIDELLSAQVILAPGFLAQDHPILRVKLKQAAQQGAKVLLLQPEGFLQDHMDFGEQIQVKNDLSALQELAKALLDAGCTSDFPGFEAFADSLQGVKVSPDMARVAALYGETKKAMVVVSQNALTQQAAALLGNIALLSGHIGSPRDGILLLRPKNNSQGLVDLGVRQGREALEGVKALLCFGEDPVAAGVDLSGLEFLMVCDAVMTDTAKQAHAFFPGAGFASAQGTFTNTERRRLPVEAAIEEEAALRDWEVAAELAHVLEKDFGFETEKDIADEMKDQLYTYKYGETGQVLGGVLAPREPRFATGLDGTAPLVQPLPCADALMNCIQERLPKGRLKD